MSDEDRQEVSDRMNDPGRALALSDGVFAIILTLLVLELHVPDLAAGQSLLDALGDIWPSFVAFLLSFLVAASAWINHRDLFALIRRTDRYLVWLNILYLLPLSILPFGAALLARYETNSIALIIYGMILIAIALARLAIWWYATERPHVLVAPLDARSRRLGFIIGAAPVGLYLIAIVIAHMAPRVSLTIYAAALAVFVISMSRSRSAVTIGRDDWDGSRA
jgi:uncharacterized membrane protein